MGDDTPPVGIPASRPRRGDRRRARARSIASVVLGLTVCAVLVVADQLSKSFVERVLDPGVFVPWIGRHVGWQLIYNPGGAFGLPAPPVLFLVVSVVLLVVVLRVLPRTTSRLQAIAYGMLLAGAIGNVLDRLLRAGHPDGGLASGYVVDFVAWGSFARFNVADSAITVGFVLLVIGLLVEERRAAAAEADAPRADGARRSPRRGRAGRQGRSSEAHG